MNYIIKKRNMLKNGDYGTNYYADKALHEHYHIKPNEILIDGHLKGRMKKRTIAHEKIEAYMMHKKHLSYPRAHRVAMQWEKHVK